MNLFRRIKEHRSTFLLVVLVVGCLFSMATGMEASWLGHGLKRMVTVTAYPFLVTKNALYNTTDYCLDFVFNYHSARKENELLVNHLAQMRMDMSRYAETRQENRRLRTLLKFAENTPRFTLEPVEIIESYKGMLRIDRGRVHGIRPSEGVITHKGVVGIITEVNDFSSTVATLHHPQCRVGAMVERNHLRAYDGVLHASSADFSQFCTLQYIDIKDENFVQIGDHVVTSPERVFPSGYPIGTINALHETSGSLWKYAEVIPEVDPYRLDEVFVVHRAAERVEEMAGPVESRIPGPGALSVSPPLPDTRPLQERFAP